MDELKDIKRRDWCGHLYPCDKCVHPAYSDATEGVNPGRIVIDEFEQFDCETPVKLKLTTDETRPVFNFQDFQERQLGEPGCPKGYSPVEISKEEVIDRMNALAIAARQNEHDYFYSSGIDLLLLGRNLKNNIWYFCYGILLGAVMGFMGAIYWSLTI